MCGLSMESRKAQRRRRITRFSIILGMLVFWTLLGAGLEIAQLWIPYRKFDLLDISWSVVGALAGSTLSLLWLLVIGDW